MIQISYLIWCKHKSYFHTHWQLFLLQIHPYIIVWYKLQMALFLFCQIISYVVRTNLWYRHLVKTSKAKLEISKFVHFAEIFQKIIATLKLNFSKFWAFFQSVLLVSYLLIQQRKTCWITEALQSHILAILTVSRQEACDRDLKPSRPRLAKIVLRPSLKTSSLQRIQQSCRIKKVVKFIDLQKLLSLYGPTIFHGCLYARHAW